ncbi:rhodanese-like domain-containing protein 8, chloroplastic isoform X1 [Canna indica]|uniref:Rhodanese-like domain-containing protein 8, chloroplastic isoform X1 n=1 Tax=Canna indica TaxID=4628 RepID=A0AAQ3KY17_9LILI|nr:rhodanese-like domain-containing protein 8, chloroplastic isoform X1 [Canna indica]
MATLCGGGGGIGHRARCRSAPLLSRTRHGFPLASPSFSFSSFFPFPQVSPLRTASTTPGVTASLRSSNRDLDAIYEELSSAEDDYVVVCFYKFVPIKDPKAEVARHLAFLQGRDIHGRIYVNQQGINAQYSGPKQDCLAYADWVKEDQRFFDILVQVSPACNGHAFPRLKLRYKPSLVQIEGGVSHLPLVDPAMRAYPLAPTEWRAKLQSMNNASTRMSKAESQASDRKCILLDVRNGYEWDIGHFQGAQRPNVDCFRSTSFGFSEQEEASSDPLAGIDKENTDILMYCTGGIRCDVYSTILRQKGFQNLYTLSGGVSNYLMNEGSAEWVGNLFVFDGRLSLPPSTFKPGAKTDAYTGRKMVHENTFAKCYVCGSQLVEFRHRNCANIDCNLLFLSCSSCVTQLRGCCCSDCTCAPRLRPLLPGHQRYQKWHIYRDGE